MEGTRSGCLPLRLIWFCVRPLEQLNVRIETDDFINQHYENCLFFGNFAYVHGYKHEDYDYGEDHIIIRDTKKNPDFVK